MPSKAQNTPIDNAPDKARAKPTLPAAGRRKKSLIKKLFKLLTYLLVTAVALLFVVIILISSGVLNGLMLGIVTDRINSSWSGKQSVLYAESLEGNVFKGLKLNNVSITVKGDTLLKLGSVEIRYGLDRLLFKDISIEMVNLADLQINLYKVKSRGDTLDWNFAYLFAAEEEEIDTAKKKFDWDIKIEDLKIRNGSVRILDSNLTDTPIKAGVRSIRMPGIDEFDFGKLDITDFDLDLSAEYNEDYKIVNLKKLSFNTNSDFTLKKLSFVASVDEKDTLSVIRSFELETGRSKITAPIISMEGLNPLDGVAYENFKNNGIDVDLIAEKFNFDDLKFFLSDLDFLDNTVSLELRADGKYGNMNVNKMVLKTPDSYYSFNGKVENIHDPEKLRFNLTGNNLVIDPSDTKKILPGLDIPDYSHIGKVNAAVKYYGEVMDFKTEFDVKSQYGNANGTLELNLNTPNYFYNTKFETSSLNIGGILNNKELESNLNLRAEVNGSGLDLNSISAKVNYEVTDSKILGKEISKSSGIVELHNSNLNADITYVSDELNTSLKGRINLSNPSDAEYTAKGTARGLDISDFTKDPEDKSNLNAAFEVEGKGLSLENMTGRFNMDFDNSYYASYRIPASPLDVKINGLGTNGSMTVSSNFFDFEAKGNFNIKEIADVIGYNLGLIADEVKRKIASDTLAQASSQSGSAKSFANLDFKYKFTAKNIKPVYQLFDTSGLVFTGVIDGNIKNSNLGFTSISNINVNDFRYGDTAVIVKNLKGSIDFENDYTKTIPLGESIVYPLSSNVSLTCDKIILGTFYLDRVNLNYNLADDNQRFIMSAMQDTAAEFRLSGSSDLDKDSIGFTLGEMLFRYKRFEMKNEGAMVIRYNADPSKKTFSFDKFKIRNNILKLSASGDLSFSDSSDFNIEVKNVKLNELIKLFSPQDTASRYYAQSKSPLRGEIRRLSIGFKGNFGEPALNIEMNTGLLRYINNKIGRIDAFVDYANSILTADVLISNAEGSGRLRLTGDVPLANPLAEKTETSPTGGIENTGINLKLKANNFQVNFFSKLIPNFADIRGLLDGEIDAAGTVANPLLSGGMTVTKGRFYFGLTGMYHRFNSVLKTQKSDLIVEQFSIFNIDDDRRHLDLWGRINFEGLKINHIDLSTSGDVVVLDRSSDGTSLGFYGDMIAGVGSPPITIKGDLKNLFVEGKLEIKSARLTFPQLPGASYDISSDNYVYKIITDTLGTEFKDTTIIVAPEDIDKVDPFMRSYIVSEEENKSSPINIVYNIDVKTLKNAYVNVSFNKVTQEELFGEVRADLNISNVSSDKMEISGGLEIVGDSYYRFYRNFKVRESRITFYGPPDDPLLNIHAVYENRSSQSTGSNGNSGVEIVLNITGSAKKPVLTLKLYENGVEVTGKDAQSDAISYLLFGVSKTELSSGQRNALARNVGTTTGSTYLSGLLSNVLRDVAPFILSTEIIYSEGDVATGTDIRVTSEVGDAIVKFGGKVFSGIDNAEVSIQYPLNKMLNINISNNLLLEIAREVQDNSLSGAKSVLTGVRLIYKIRY